jgi:hypothetical protein
MAQQKDDRVKKTVCGSSPKSPGRGQPKKPPQDKPGSLLNRLEDLAVGEKRKKERKHTSSKHYPQWGDLMGQ